MSAGFHPPEKHSDGGRGGGRRYGCLVGSILVLFSICPMVVAVVSQPAVLPPGVLAVSQREGEGRGLQGRLVPCGIQLCVCVGQSVCVRVCVRV